MDGGGGKKIEQDENNDNDDFVNDDDNNNQGGAVVGSWSCRRGDNDNEFLSPLLSICIHTQACKCNFAQCYNFFTVPLGNLATCHCHFADIGANVVDDNDGDGDADEDDFGGGGDDDNDDNQDRSFFPVSFFKKWRRRIRNVSPLYIWYLL